MQREKNADFYSYTVTAFKKTEIHPIYTRQDYTFSEHLIDYSYVNDQTMKQFNFYIVHPRDTFNIVWKRMYVEFCPITIGHDNGNTAHIIGMTVSMDTMQVATWFNQTLFIQTQDCQNSHTQFTTFIDHAIFSLDGSRLFVILAGEIGLRVIITRDEKKDVRRSELILLDELNAHIEQIIHFNDEFCRPNGVATVQSYRHIATRVCACHTHLNQSLLIVTSSKMVMWYRYNNDEFTLIQSFNLNQNIPLLNVKFESHIVNHSHIIEKPFLMSLSSDARFLVVVEQGKVVYMYQLQDSEEFKYEAVGHFEFAHKIVTSVAVSTFQHYYLQLGLVNGQLAQIRVDEPLVNSCHPRARLSSYYLPPIHLFSNNDTELNPETVSYPAITTNHSVILDQESYKVRKNHCKIEYVNF